MGFDFSLYNEVILPILLSVCIIGMSRVCLSLSGFLGAFLFVGVSIASIFFLIYYFGVVGIIITSILILAYVLFYQYYKDKTPRGGNLSILLPKNENPSKSNTESTIINNMLSELSKIPATNGTQSVENIVRSALEEEKINDPFVVNQDKEILPTFLGMEEKIILLNIFFKPYVYFPFILLFNLFKGTFDGLHSQKDYIVLFVVFSIPFFLWHLSIYIYRKYRDIFEIDIYKK